MTILDSDQPILVIWEYLVRSTCRQEFLTIYSANGRWAQLFRRCPGYLQTELLQDPADNLKFLTIDFWRSLETYRAMHRIIADDYDRLDRSCAALTDSETFLGTFSRGHN